MVKAPRVQEFKIGFDPNDMNQGLESMPISVSCHSSKRHVPTYFNTFLQISTIYLLPHKLGTLQIKMMGVLVVVEVALFSF